MRRLPKIELAIAILQLEANRAEPLSEFKAARLYIDLFFDDIVAALKSGMPQADVIHMVVIVAKVSRKTASQQLWRQLKQAGIAAQPAIPAAPVAPAPRPAVPAKPAYPAPKPAPAAPVLAKKEIETPVPTIAAPAQPAAPGENRPANQPRTIVIGKGFLGEEEKWTTPDEMEREKARRAAIERSSIIGSGGSLDTNKDRQ